MTAKRDEQGRRRGQRPVGSGEPAPVRDSLELLGKSVARSQPTDAMDLDAMSVEVERRMVRGDRFSDVEVAIDSSTLSADEKSALWLLGWSYVNWRAQRREARAHLARFGPRRAAPPGRRRRILRPVS